MSLIPVSVPVGEVPAGKRPSRSRNMDPASDFAQALFLFSSISVNRGRLLRQVWIEQRQKGKHEIRSGELDASLSAGHVTRELRCVSSSVFPPLLGFSLEFPFK